MKLSLPRIPLHPFFFTAFPICSLLSANLDKAGVVQLFLPLSIVLAACTLLYLIVGLILRKAQKAALITSVVCLSFLTYGHVILSFMAFVTSNIQPLVFLWTYYGLVALLVVLLFKFAKEEKLSDISFILDTVSFCVLVSTLLPIFTFSINKYDMAERWQIPAADRPVQSGAADPKQMPDVYYIILDGMERSDVLQKAFQVDDSAFMKFLDSKGFYVAQKSHSNYAYTALSMASSMNMQYINWLSKHVGEKNKDWNPLFEMIVSSEVIKAFKARGYRYVHFNSSFFATGTNPLADETKHVSWISPLITACLQLTPVGIHTQLWHPAHDELRKQRMSALAALEEVAGEAGPKIVFAHIVMPHMPFLFDENGNEVNGSLNSYMDEWADRKGYRGQIIFLQKKMIGVIENMLKRSANPPIIIIQGDHGAGGSCEFNSEKPSREFLEERFSIMNAYLLPGNGREKLYPTITPVNSFRVILDHYLQYKIPLLEDKVYFSPFDQPYKFIDVTSEVD